EERRDDQHRGHDEERDLLGAAFGRVRRCGDGSGSGFGDDRHHAGLPHRPAGRSSSTIAIMTKITVLEASGKNTLVRPSITPSAKPVRIAPMIEHTPPITTTANTRM